MESLMNHLSASRDITSEKDLVLYTLSRMGDDYRVFVQTVTTREAKLSFSFIYVL